MTPATPATEVRDDERRRPVWKPLAAAGIGGAVLIATGFGVFATLQATASNTTAQQVDSGTLSLVLGNATGSAGFTHAVSSIAPTDTVRRFVNLTNNGTLAAQGLGVRLTAAGSSSLITDGASTRALTAVIEECSGGTWTASADGGVCSTGSVRQVLGATKLSALTAATPAAPLPLDIPAQREAGAVTSLRITLNLPDQTEVVHNGATPSANAAGTIQNQSAQLTWTFNQTQRGAATTSA